VAVCGVELSEGFLERGQGGGLVAGRDEGVVFAVLGVDVREVVGGDGEDAAHQEVVLEGQFDKVALPETERVWLVWVGEVWGDDDGEMVQEAEVGDGEIGSLAGAEEVWGVEGVEGCWTWGCEGNGRLEVRWLGLRLGLVVGGDGLLVVAIER
jgi:hypothetical protein